MSPEEIRKKVYANVIAVIDREITRANLVGEFRAAEQYEVIRAKVKAQAERQSP